MTALTIYLIYIECVLILGIEAARARGR